MHFLSFHSYSTVLIFLDSIDLYSLTLLLSIVIVSGALIVLIVFPQDGD